MQRRIQNFLGVVYEGGGERTGEEVVKTCVKHSQTKNGAKGLLFRADSE